MVPAHRRPNHVAEQARSTPRLDEACGSPRDDAPKPLVGVSRPSVAEVPSAIVHTGDEVPVESELQIDPSSSVGLLRARPAAPLEPNARYVWQLDGESHREFTTNAELDRTPPSFMDLIVVAAVEHEVVDGSVANR